MRVNRSVPSLFVAGGIAVIAVAMIVGPLFSPTGFNWVVHSTSEQAGQHIPGGWIMRIGFTAYGLGVALASVIDRKANPLLRSALLLFGLGLVATAIWSNAPILPDLPTDIAEDNLHSIASGVVGASFAFACAVRLFGPGASRFDGLALAGMVIAVAFPLGMSQFPEVRGLLQRAMFVFSFVFVAREFTFARARL